MEKQAKKPEVVIRIGEREVRMEYGHHGPAAAPAHEGGPISPSEDRVDEASMESFPASDSPGYNR